MEAVLSAAGYSKFRTDGCGTKGWAAVVVVVVVVVTGSAGGTTDVVPVVAVGAEYVFV